MANSYPCGTVVKCEAYFYSDAAKTTLADPSAIKFRKQTPAGVVTEHVYGTDAALVRGSTGYYYELVTVDAAGPWKYVFKGTGAIGISLPGRFEAEATLFEI